MKLLEPMPVEFYPNTGMEVGWAIALERELVRQGWSVSAEVPTSPRRHVDLVARIGAVLLVIEVKAQAAGPNAVSQLRAYLDDIQESYPLAMGVLAAPSLSATVRYLPADMAFLPLVRV